MPHRSDPFYYFQAMDFVAKGDLLARPDFHILKSES